MRYSVLSLLGGLALSALTGWVVSASAQSIIDPTRPPDFVASAPSAAKPRFRLTAILIARDRRLAVINGVIVGVGASLPSAKVLGISPDAVRLRLRSGRLMLLSLYPSHLRTALGPPQ